jgi:hypothetical protein
MTDTSTVSASFPRMDGSRESHPARDARDGREARGHVVAGDRSREQREADDGDPDEEGLPSDAAEEGVGPRQGLSRR